MHALVVAAGRNPAGRRWFRAVLETHHHLDFGAERLLVEIDRLLAAPVEEQIRCRHGPLSFVQVVWKSLCRCDCAMRRVQAVCARLRVAISILRICNIERMTRSEFSFFIISGSAFGMICHERPNLSLSPAPGPSSPFLSNPPQEVAVLLLLFAVTLEHHALFDLKMRPAFSARNFCPSISNSTVITVPAFLP